MKSKRMNVPVFVFESHLDFIREWYSYARRFGLTQREFLLRAGIKAQAFLSDVMNGRKKIGRSHIDGFVRALELTGDEAEYFGLLVEKELCRTPAERVAATERLATVRKRHLGALLPSRTHEYFASWRYPVVREYLVARGAPVTAKEVAADLINLHLSIQEAAQALSKLTAWELAAFDETTGCYSATDRSVITYQTMPHAVVNDVKRELMEAAVHAMEEMPSAERHASMAVRGMSSALFEAFCARIDDLRQEFLARSGDRNDADLVAALTIQLFPVMRVSRPEGEKETIDEKQ
jgi:uncharacterized protein (TIGR02147 family)